MWADSPYPTDGAGSHDQRLFCLAAVRATLEAGGTIVINCGVVTLDFGSELVIDSDTTIDGLGKTTLSGGDAHRVIRIDGSVAGVTVTLKRLAVVDGRAANLGGGVYADGTSDKQVKLSLDQTSFSSNHASTGGAVYSDGFEGNASVTVTNSTFNGNSASSEGGGAVYSYGYQGSASLTIADSSFNNNTGGTFGGAVDSFGGGGSATLTVTNTTFNGNSATYGGAVYATAFGGTSNVETTNTTFSGNTAQRGGAVYSYGAASLSATNTTFSGNVGSIFGGAVASDGSITFVATVLAGSTGSHCLDLGGATFTSNDFNLADNNDTSCNLTNTNDQIVADAGLAGLADNGGPTQTHALLLGSPATDAAGCFEATDQRGVPRPQDGNADGSFICDIGAVERIGTNLLGTSLHIFPRLNKVVAGSSVSVYFSYDGNTQTNILASALVGVVSCTSKQLVAGTQAALSGGLYWQANYQRYVYVWKTDTAWPAGCRQLVLTFADGSELRLNVQIIKQRW